MELVLYYHPLPLADPSRLRSILAAHGAELRVVSHPQLRAVCPPLGEGVSPSGGAGHGLLRLFPGAIGYGAGRFQGVRSPRRPKSSPHRHQSELEPVPPGG